MERWSAGEKRGMEREVCVYLRTVDMEGFMQL